VRGEEGQGGVRLARHCNRDDGIIRSQGFRCGYILLPHAFARICTHLDPRYYGVVTQTVPNTKITTLLDKVK